jgi:hypothetical protein
MLPSVAAVSWMVLVRPARSAGHVSSSCHDSTLMLPVHEDQIAVPVFRDAWLLLKLFITVSSYGY